jgi:phospho-N-acetylmuramoyl-pentapeptide-transferase
MIALLVAGAVSLVFTLLLTPLFIKLFHRLGWGQFIRDDGPQSHHTKRGTATMGGIVLILGAVIGYFVGHLAGRDPVTLSGLLVLFLMVGLGVVGFVDDFLKVRRQRSLGLGGWAKVLGQVIVGVVFATIALVVPTGNGKPPASTMISAIRDVPWLDFMALGTVIGTILFLAWIVLLTVSTSNGVNVADGLDGLATGSSILAIGSYVIIGFWQSNQICGGARIDESTRHACYTVTDPLDLAVVAAAVCGGLIGFLWYNTSPAQFFIVTGSVILQRAYFKITHGKRIFRMSPLHHHFELKGWAEVTVVVRFWIIAGLCVAAGVGLFYLEWIARVQ